MYFYFYTEIVTVHTDSCFKGELRAFLMLSLAIKRIRDIVWKTVAVVADAICVSGAQLRCRILDDEKCVIRPSRRSVVRDVGAGKMGVR